MTLSITAQRCDYDTYNITISSPVEPDGGDHYCVVDCTERVSMDIKLDGVPVVGSFGMYFTSAGESYELKVKNTGAEGNPELTLSWPYTVTALYAPAWATLKRNFQVTLTFDGCCTDQATMWFANSAPAPPGIPTSGSACIAGGDISIFTPNNDGRKCFTLPCSGSCNTPPDWTNAPGDRYFADVNFNWDATLSGQSAGIRAAFLASTCDTTITCTISRSGYGWSFTSVTTLHIVKTAASWVTTVTPIMYEADCSGNLGFPTGSTLTHDAVQTVALNGMGGCGAIVVQPSGTIGATSDCFGSYAWVYADGRIRITIGIRL